MLDVRDAAACAAFVEHAQDEFGAPAILVNNAGATRDNLLARMKDDAIYVNTARAMLHDTDALVRALESGTLGGAGLDHFEGEHLPTDHPLQSMSNVVLTPHIGGATYDTEANHSKLIADGLDQLLGGGKPDNLVNPEVLS